MLTSYNVTKVCSVISRQVECVESYRKSMEMLHFCIYLWCQAIYIFIIRELREKGRHGMNQSSLFIPHWDAHLHAPLLCASFYFVRLRVLGSHIAFYKIWNRRENQVAFDYEYVTYINSASKRACEFILQGLWSFHKGMRIERMIMKFLY